MATSKLAYEMHTKKFMHSFTRENWAKNLKTDLNSQLIVSTVLVCILVARRQPHRVL